MRSVALAWSDSGPGDARAEASREAGSRSSWLEDGDRRSGCVDQRPWEEAEDERAGDHQDESRCQPRGRRQAVLLGGLLHVHLHDHAEIVV